MSMKSTIQPFQSLQSKTTIPCTVTSETATENLKNNSPIRISKYFQQVPLKTYYPAPESPNDLSANGVSKAIEITVDVHQPPSSSATNKKIAEKKDVISNTENLMKKMKLNLPLTKDVLKIPLKPAETFLEVHQPPSSSITNTKPAKKKDVISNKENLMKKIKLNLPLTKDVLKIPLKPAETIVEVHQPPSSFVTNTKPAEKKDVISNGGLKISTALALSSKAASQTVKLQLPRSYCENEEIFINGKKSKIIAIRKVNDINFSEILLKQKIDKFYPEFATKSVKFPKLEDPEKTKMIMINIMYHFSGIICHHSKENLISSDELTSGYLSKKKKKKYVKKLSSTRNNVH
ncbi:uncharacterized protein LOC141534627 isoform X2 [Cotesia typhae]|uniref:uncharacterized protein LOC141534627 isoform X2 n=1 Tax=Cotesia typhae TaxID=2053667 RepID=UPI003D68358E